MTFDELKDKAVISVQGARKVGSVDDVFVDPADWHIAALSIKSKSGGPGYLVSKEYIQGIGPDAVTVPTSDALQLMDRAQLPAGLPSLRAMLNSKVVTEDGELLGTISGVEIEANTRRVRAFEYRSGALAGLLGRQYRFDPGLVVGVGSGLVTVREAARPSREAGA
jgi:sporulation protein YlmC with PRC-barrel domain